MYLLDLVEEIIERQLRKYKNKLVAKSQGHPTASSAGNNFKKEFFESEEDSVEDDEIRIEEQNVLVSNQCIRRMHVYRWSYWGIVSFVFSNAETDEVNVVYKRKDGSFGLIEPEFA